jgi:RNA-directed DNA polymerase
MPHARGSGGCAHPLAGLGGCARLDTASRQDPRRGLSVGGHGFEFMGYRFEPGQRWVHKKSLMGLRDKIRAQTKRNRGDSIECIVASLNPVLGGWFGYLRHAHRFTFSTVDGFIRRRLRAILRRQLHRPGQGHCLHDHRRWPNAFFANLGLFTMSKAHRLAR